MNHYVYIRQGAVLPVCRVIADPDFETQEALTREGWELVWDSAPSEVEGYRQAILLHDAVPED
jgi:hypothetical protein